MAALVVAFAVATVVRLAARRLFAVDWSPRWTVSFWSHIWDTWPCVSVQTSVRGLKTSFLNLNIYLFKNPKICAIPSDRACPDWSTWKWQLGYSVLHSHPHPNACQCLRSLPRNLNSSVIIAVAECCTDLDIFWVLFEQNVWTGPESTRIGGRSVVIGYVHVIVCDYRESQRFLSPLISQSTRLPLSHFEVFVELDIWRGNYCIFRLDWIKYRLG